MKLYAFKPNGHGECSFFTIAKNKKQAIEIIDKHIKDKYYKNGELDYRAKGWSTDYYKIFIIKEGEVIENDND